ncbi:MAG: hypothetical protein R3326_03035 [Gemmatimonadota bacterium]|nr:hypothetical protein [Gemmatimonadota bacterium]
MRASFFLAALLALSVAWAPDTATAQDEDTRYIYAVYYECGPNTAEAVATIRDDFGPIIQRKIDAGAMTAWGLYRHNTGNSWTLVLYLTGDDVGSLNTALEEAGAEYFGDHPDESAALNEACPNHEDYIWTSELSSGPEAGAGQQSPTAAMSVYWVCEMNREAVADMIVEHVWAPYLDQQVADGKLTGWTWNEHYIGGEIRRLLNRTAANHEALMTARDEMIEADLAPAAIGAEFSDICYSHQDNLYDIVTTSP